MKTVKFTATLRRIGYPEHQTEPLTDRLAYDETKTNETDTVRDYLEGFCGNRFNIIDVTIETPASK